MLCGYTKVLQSKLRVLQSPGETALQICALKTETKNNSAKDFSSGIRLLSNPETRAAGLNLAKSAILSGQVYPDALLGQLSSLHAGNSPHLPNLLIDVLSLEEKQPGTLTLRLMPFFSPLFLERSLPPEITTRYLALAVRASRVSAEELTDIIVRSSVRELLNGIIGSAKRLTPALYPEIATRLGSLSRNGLNTIETRLAAEERIQKASDRLEQLISEATSASDDRLKRQFFFNAATLAKEQGQMSRSVDLATKVESPSLIDDFLVEIVSVALKKKSPQDASYAISKMTDPLRKFTGFRLLGEYHGANREQIKSKEAFIQSDKQLELVANSNEKAKAFLLLAKSVLQYEPVDADEIFRKAVKAINNLPSPEKDQETMYYVHLLPIAEELIRSFRLLANRESGTAISLASEIKLSELRVSALSGAYSSHE